MSLVAGNACEKRRLTQWGYNWGGKVFAYILTQPVCVYAPRLPTVTDRVAELRADVIEALSEPPN